MEDNSKEREKIVNGGLVYFPLSAEWPAILKSGEFLEKKVAFLDQFRRTEAYLKPIIQKYPELRLGLYSPKLDGSGLSAIVILEIDGELQKVQLETLTCEGCGWTGNTVTPMIPDLHFPYPGVGSEQMKKAEKYPILPCPKCGTKLPPRWPIWTEPYSKEGIISRALGFWRYGVYPKHIGRIFNEEELSLATKEEANAYLVNGETVYIPLLEEWTEIFTIQRFHGKNRRVFDLLRDDLDCLQKLSRTYPEIQLGLYSSVFDHYGLAPIMLLNINGKLQKVHIKMRVCEICNWEGAVADPVHEELYGYDHRAVEIKNAEAYPVRPCPKCGDRLPGHPIWTEPYSKDI